MLSENHCQFERIKFQINKIKLGLASGAHFELVGGN